MAAKAISSPVPVEWYPTLAVVMVSVGLMLTASFFIYEATTSRRNRSLAKEIVTASIASVFLGFGSLFVLLASGVYVWQLASTCVVLARMCHMPLKLCCFLENMQSHMDMIFIIGEWHQNSTNVVEPVLESLSCYPSTTSFPLLVMGHKPHQSFNFLFHNTQYDHISFQWLRFRKKVCTEYTSVTVSTT